MTNNTKDSTTTLKVACAILFILFVVCYVHLFQCDVLGMTQYSWSDGLKHYNRNFGTVILASIAVVMTMAVSLFSRLPKRLFALNFWPAFLTLGLLSSGRLCNGSVTIYAAYIIVYFVLLMIVVVLMRSASSYAPFLQPLRATTFLSHPWWTNLSLMFIGIMIVYSMSNNNRDLHTRLAVERLCYEKQWKEAQQYGYAAYDNDSSLTMLRAMALAREQHDSTATMLGERLFQYEIKGSSRSLLPQSDGSVRFLLHAGYNIWQTLGFVPYSQKEAVTTILSKQLAREEHRLKLYNDTTLDKEYRDSLSKPLCYPATRDYLLCAYLLDRDLDNFVKTLPKYYALNDSMPQHYREACVLYAKVKGVVVYRNAALEADLADFFAIKHSQKNPTLRNAALRDTYFGTYWYYYFRRK